MIHSSHKGYPKMWIVLLIEAQSNGLYYLKMPVIMVLRLKLMVFRNKNETWITDLRLSGILNL